MPVANIRIRLKSLKKENNYGKSLRNRKKKNGGS